MPRPTVSVAMIARNEERILARTLGSVQWADEIVVVDSGSTDSTPEIARSLGARHIFHRDFKGHAEQKNIAIGLCTSDWILLLDADEVVPEPLAQEIQAAVERAEHSAFWIPRSNLYLNRWMRHGGLWPDAKLRLFRRGTALVQEDIGPHGTPQTSAHKGQLKSALQHYGYPDFAMYLDHMNEYSTGTVVAMSRRLQKTPDAVVLLLSVASALLGWVKNYIVRGGFLDGAAGWIFHLNHAFYVHWKYVKVWETRQRKTFEPGES